MTIGVSSSARIASSARPNAVPEISRSHSRCGTNPVTTEIANTMRKALMMIARNGNNSRRRSR